MLQLWNNEIVRALPSPPRRERRGFTTRWCEPTPTSRANLLPLFRRVNQLTSYQSTLRPPFSLTPLSTPLHFSSSSSSSRATCVHVIRQPAKSLPLVSGLRSLPDPCIPEIPRSVKRISKIRVQSFPREFEMELWNYYLFFINISLENFSLEISSESFFQEFLHSIFQRDETRLSVIEEWSIGTRFHAGIYTPPPMFYLWRRVYMCERTNQGRGRNAVP